MPIVPVTAAGDPRLSDYLRLRDVTLRKLLETDQGIFIAEGEKVIRRAVQAGYRPRSFLLAERWLAGLADVTQRWPDVPVYLVTEQLAETVTGFHVHRGALASMHREQRHRLEDLLQIRSSRCRRGRGRSHERRRDHTERGRPRLGRRDPCSASSGPSLPTVDQGEHGRGVLAALGQAQ